MLDSAHRACTANPATSCRRHRDAPSAALCVSGNGGIVSRQVLVLMVPYTSISDTDGAYAMAFQAVGLGWAKYLVSAGTALPKTP